MNATTEPRLADEKLVAQPVGGVRSADQVIADAMQSIVDQDAARVRLLIAANRWADLHPLGVDEEAGVFADLDLRLTGEGVPGVGSAVVAEFAAALRLSTQAGEFLMAEALELRHRLPRCWVKVLEGKLRPGRASSIAGRTLGLSAEAADFVDRNVAFEAERISTKQVERTVAAAMLKFMPDQVAEQAAREAERVADPRRVDFAHGVEVGGPGRVFSQLSATLDLQDGLTLDQAVTVGAAQLKALGVEGHDGALRAIALAELASPQAPLDFAGDPELSEPTRSGAGENVADERGNAENTEPATGPVRAAAHRRVQPPKPVTLFLHLHLDAITGGGLQVGRVGTLQTPVDVDQIRVWLGNPAAQVTVKPVIDLNQPVAVDAYEIPDRIRERVTLREPCCVFPWCDKPSTAPGVDLDHITPYAVGGATSTENLAPLCRRHHRLKTHTGWDYRRELDGSCYRWSSPHGLRFRRDRHGTTPEADLPPPKPPDPTDPVISRRKRRPARKSWRALTPATTHSLADVLPNFDEQRCDPEPSPVDLAPPF